VRGRRLGVLDAIVLVIVAAAILLTVRSIGRAAPATPGKTVLVTVVFRSRPTSLYRKDAELLTRGEAVSAQVGTTFTPLGRVAAVRVVPELTVVATPQGHLRAVANPIQKRLLVEVRAKASLLGDGSYQFQGTPIYIGQTTTLRAGVLHVRGYVVDIVPVGRETAPTSLRGTRSARTPVPEPGGRAQGGGHAQGGSAP